MLDRDGEKIGKLEDVYIDTETDADEFGTVKEGPDRPPPDLRAAARRHAEPRVRADHGGEGARQGRRRTSTGDDLSALDEESRVPPLRPRLRLPADAERPPPRAPLTARRRRPGPQTSTHVAPAAADASTASTIRIDRAPSAKRGSPSGCSPPRSPRTCRARTPRSSPCSPRRARAAASEHAARRGVQRRRVAPDRLVVLAAADPEGLGRSCSKRSDASEPASSRCRWFLRPGETWLTSIVPTTPPSVRNMTVARSSVTHRPAGRRSPAPTGRERRGVAAVGALGDDGRGLRAHRRDPLAGDELDEVAPVRADVGERARRAALRRVDPPVVVVGRGEPVLQVAAVDEADRRRSRPPRRAPGPRRPSRCSGRRTARSRRAPTPRAAGDSARPRRPSSRAASRRRRACRPRARPRPAGRAGGWACRCGRRRRRRRRPPPRASRRRAARRGRRRRLARALGRSMPRRRRPRPRPGARSATWTGPMKPVAPSDGDAQRRARRRRVRTAPRARPSWPRRRCRAGGRGSRRGSCAWPAR